MRAPANRSRSRGRSIWRAAQFLLLLPLLLGLAMPVLPVVPVAAQPTGQLPPPLPAPSRVALSGSFQTALGCPADFDPTCPRTELQDNHDGSWSAILPVPPGDYTFRIVASSDTERALGQNGDPNGADLTLSVPGDAAGAYFRYDSLTGEIDAVPVQHAVMLATDLGEQFAMAPTPDGYEVTWDAQPGAYGFQIQVDGQPVTQDNVSLDRPQRVIVAVDQSGAVTTKDTLRDTQLDVSAVNDAGQPRPDSCFALVDRDNRLRAQACDTDDGQADGVVPLRVPNGLDDDTYSLFETYTANDASSAPEQQLTLGDGRFEAQAQVAGAEAQQEATAEPVTEEAGEQQPSGQPVVEPGDRPGQLTVIPVDDAGNPLPGACFAVLEFGFEQCDDDGDGTVVFDAVPATPITLRQTAPPAGFAAVPDMPLTVEVTGTRVRIPQQPTGEQAPAEETPQEQPAEETPPVSPAGANQVVLTLRDRDGQPVTGACWSMSERSGGNAIQRCDADDGEDGTIVFDAVPAGRYRLDEVSTPPDFRPAEGQGIDVADGQPAQVTIEYRPEQGQGQQQSRGEPGRLVIAVADEDGNPMAETCFDLTGPSNLPDVCDRQNDGRLNIPDLPPGAYTVTQTHTAAGFTPAAPTTVDVPDGDTIELPIVNQRAGVEPAPASPTATPEPAPETPTPQAQAAEGSLVIRATDQDGNLIPSSCYTIEIPPGGQGFGPFCDEDGNGAVEIQGISPGPIAVTETAPPANSAAADPPTQQLDIAAGQGAEVTFQHGAAAQEQAADGTLEVRIADANGQPVAACVNVDGDAESFSQCDNQQGDADDQPGQLTIEQVIPGSYGLSLANLPEGSEAPAAQQVDVAAGDTATVTFTVGAGSAPGTLVLFVEDENGARLGSSCFTLESDAQTLTDVCDQGDDGRLNIPDLPAGDYTVTQTRAAADRPLAAPQQVTVTPGQTVELTLQNPSAAATETPPPSPTATATTAPEATATPESAPEATTAPEEGDTGAVELQAFDDAGNPIGGQCYTLTGSPGTFGPFCDDGEGDTSPDPGVLIVEGLPSGTYEAELQSAEAQPDVEQAQQVKQRRSVSVRRGGRPTRARFDVRQQQNRRGGLLIRVRDQDGDYLSDACFAVIADGESSPAEEVCDNRSGDENSSDGRILINGLREGRYTLTQTAAPNGYSAAADQSIRIQGGGVREVAMTNQIARQQPATLDVETVDQQGNLLPSACYTIVKGNNSNDACDTNGDGVTRFADVAAGSYVVRQTQAPTGGFATAGATATLLDAGQSATVTVVNEARTGSLVIRQTDDANQPLGGACFALLRDNDALYAVCDNDASDGNGNPGAILLDSIAPGNYTLRETQTPAGFLTAADQDVTISPNQRAQANVVNTPAPPPERNGDLRVFKVDASGNALAGSCFALLDGNGQSGHQTCDVADGADDGVVLISSVAIGDYTLRETRRPSADYATAADQAITIAENQTTDVQVVNQLRLGRLLIRKSDPNGTPLVNACFDLAEDGGGAACTDDNGELLFDGLVPGVYTVSETQAPEGYLALAAIDPATVRPGSTTTLDLVDQPAPPPPDSGSLQVVKFLCPATEGNGGIAFVDSSDPDGGGLARTAGCDLGDAAFTLERPTNPLSFRTGESGRYQATLPTGDYTLTEQSTGASEDVSISINTLTTVVVVNYIEPEGPSPAAIDVVKYTCDPGFQGRVWQDFADGCLSNESLTNNVAFRLSGVVSARRVTGDAGIGGATRFDGLPAGDYTVREETPAGTVAVYAFCGVDPNAPDGRAVGAALTLRLASAQNVTCHWFNVPEDLAGNTGAITVYKYACPVTTPSASYDWFGRCDPQGQGVRFSLSAWDGANFVPVTTAATDSDGILRLTRLQPNTYDLKEVDGVWCHAESDSVNADGHVVVSAGKRASVWIFNCVGAKNPPNTGAGPEGAGAVPPATTSTLGAGLSFIWPLFGLALARLRKRE